MNIPFKMNVPDSVEQEFLEKKFSEEAAKADIILKPSGTDMASLFNLKGHNSVGGMRASIYNAMPMKGIEALIEFMEYFKERNG